VAIKTLSIKGADSQDAARQAKEALGDFKPVFLLFFASSKYDPSGPAAAFSAAFPGCKVIGCTSHSEYRDSGYTSGSISVMAMDAQSVSDVCVEVVENIGDEPDLHGAVGALMDHFGGADEIFEHFDRYVGIVLFESGAKAEETFMDHLGTATDLLFVGGSSSAFEDGVSRVYAEGKSYEGAAVLAVLKTVNGYDVLKTQSASIFSEQKLTVTKSDLKKRLLYEFDGKPCGEVYAQVLGVPVAEVQNYFVSNPLGIVAGDEIFVRTFDQIRDGGITLHCGLPEGSEVNVLKIGDIVADTRQALDSTITYEPAGLINFNCLYRTFEMLNKGLTEPYCALFGRCPSIGCSTGGEAFLGHINETSTILILK